MPLDWHSVVNTMTDVQRLVHLAMRQDAIDEDRTRTELLKQARRIFEEELTIQAGRVGCPGRRGRLSNGPILTKVNELCKTWATSQTNTYNYDLAGAILSIAADTPTANRHVYAKRLQEWDASRQSQRGPLIAQYIEGAVRALANQHFYEQNGAALGYAILQPSEAVCPVCQGWIQRGEVPLKVAMNNPPPYHFRCFPPDALVMLPDGSEKHIDQITEGEVVACRGGAGRVIRVFQRHTKEVLYRVSVHGRVLQLTGDHPVLTPRGWLSARELQVGDSVVLVYCHG